MDAIEPNWPSLIKFALVWSIACVGFFFVSGSLPVRAAPQQVRSGMGPALVWLNFICVLVLAVGAIILAASELRATTSIVFGGLIFLFSPFAIQDLPSDLKDSKLGLLLLLLIHAGTIVALYMSGSLFHLGRVTAH
ncbi:MAG: hypothetical protein ACR2PG_01760 [Hyphomicrobiaceae bacterium]